MNTVISNILIFLKNKKSQEIFLKMSLVRLQGIKNDTFLFYRERTLVKISNTNLGIHVIEWKVNLEKCFFYNPAMKWCEPEQQK